MSAFIVTETTLSAVVNVICSKDGQEIALYLDRPDLLPNDPEGLFRALLDMNAAAVAYRYTEPQALCADYRFRWLPNLTRVQAYKAGQCLIYQCAEGDVPERPLFRALALFFTRLAERMVRDRPDYDRADWDMPDDPKPAEIVRLSDLTR